MLTAAYLDVLPDPILALYDEYMQSVLNDIARRLVKTGRVTDTAAWQMQRLSESGKVYDTAVAELIKMTGKSDEVLRETFTKAGVKTMQFDDAIYKAAGLNPLPLNLSPAMADVLAVGLQKTKNAMRNLTLSTALSSQEAFIRASDLAYMQVTGGAMDYQSAIKRAIKSAASDGLTVIYPSGRREQLDVALRRAVLTGVSQTAGKLQERRADEMGADLVQTSAHIGARNTGTGPANHEGWQGKIFSRSGTHEKYPDFVESTGYGTGGGLMGWNCRHSFYPFFERISAEHYKQAELKSYADKRVTYNGRAMSVYEATQVQRAVERKIRKAKREAGVLEAAGLDNTDERLAIGRYQAQMRSFTKQTGLQRQRFREQTHEATKQIRALRKVPKKTAKVEQSVALERAPYMPSQTVDEAEAWARSRGINANYGEHLEAANWANQSIERLEKAGLEWPSYLRIDMTPEDFANDKSTFAFYGHKTGREYQRISLNPNMDWSRIGQETERIYKSRWLSGDDPNHIFFHEFGHAMDWQSRSESREKRWPGNFSESLQRQTLASKKVSRYGGTMPGEFIAEVFAGRIEGIDFDADVMELYRLLGGPEIK